LREQPDAPHSVFFVEAYEAPFSTWTHRKYYQNIDGTLANRTKVYTSNENPPFARRREGVPIQILHAEKYNEWFSLVERLERQAFRPQYIVIDLWHYNESLFVF
jgi:hypothetical protein